jgi:PAS domain S-box-containing protein
MIGAALAALLSLGFLVMEVMREFRSLSSANSDNVHWVLSQAEVEFLEFRSAIETAMHDDAGPQEFEQLVIEFDVFYSRMTTLTVGQLYAPLRDIDIFGEAIVDIRGKLDAMIPLIDGPREELRAALPQLLIDADSMRLPLRAVATSGLQYFAARSDMSREGVANTLLRLAALTVGMFLALIIAVGRARRISQQTERRGEELANAYARLNTILETSLDAVIVSNLHGKILNFNAAAERIFGYRFEDVHGRSIGDVIIPDYLRDMHGQWMKRMRDTGIANIVGNGRVRLEAKRRNGEIFPVELALQKARAGEDEVIIAFLRDISQRIAAENELTQARDEALAGEKAKAEFLAMMTHEIRTPLNGLLGNLALMKKTPLTPEQEHHLRHMDISGALLMHHVDSVLDVARFEAGVTRTQEEVVHLGRLFQDIVDSQASAAQAVGNRIGWDWCGPCLDWARLDASRLRQVLLNLVGNAIKFTRDGRILIEAEITEDDAAQAGSDPARVFLELRVIDTGIGIPDEEQARIFEDFHTVNDPASPRSGNQPGTGLGLGITRRFVEALGGTIGVESTLGEGSVFWLRLPVTPAEEPVATAPSSPDAQAIAPCNILLVEDNEINLDLAHRMLAAMGHQVVEAHDGEQAIARAAVMRFDLILMDIRMPVIDGLEATRQIREGGGPNADAPIIAVSANVLPEARDRFLAAGMSGFLPKPLDPEDLAQVVSTYCGAKPAQAPAAVPVPDTPPASTPDLSALIARYTAEATRFFDALDKGQMAAEQIAEDAHKLAGTAAAFGQVGLRAALNTLEEAAETGSAQDIAIAATAARAAWQTAAPPSLD